MTFNAVYCDFLSVCLSLLPKRHPPKGDYGVRLRELLDARLVFNISDAVASPSALLRLFLKINLA